MRFRVTTLSTASFDQRVYTFFTKRHRICKASYFEHERLLKKCVTVLHCLSSPPRSYGGTFLVVWKMRAEAYSIFHLKNWAWKSARFWMYEKCTAIRPGPVPHRWHPRLPCRGRFQQAPMYLSVFDVLALLQFLLTKQQSRYFAVSAPSQYELHLPISLLLPRVTPHSRSSLDCDVIVKAPLSYFLQFSCLFFPS